MNKIRLAKEVVWKLIKGELLTRVLKVQQVVKRIPTKVEATLTTFIEVSLGPQEHTIAAPKQLSFLQTAELAKGYCMKTMMMWNEEKLAVASLAATS